MSTVHKKWATGDLVEATAFNSYVQNQIVGVYDDSSARDAAFGGTGEPTLAEGMVCYLKDTNELQIYSGSAWVPLLDLDTFSVSSGAYTIKGNVTVGVDDTGHDVKFFGATSGKYFEWDESADRVNIEGQLRLANITSSNHDNVSLMCGGDYDLTPDAHWNAHFCVDGNGYAGGIAMDGTAMWVGHNATSRALYFCTDETMRTNIDRTAPRQLILSMDSQMLVVLEQRTFRLNAMVMFRTPMATTQSYLMNDSKRTSLILVTTTKT